MTGLYVAQEAEHQRIEWLGSSVLSILLDGAATDGQLMMHRVVADHGVAPPMHVHRYEDEIFLLLSGAASVWYGEQRHELGEGGVVFLPRHVPHSYRVTSERADLLAVATPAGLEGMFRELGHDLSMPRPEGLEVVADPEVSERYGSIVVGPPPS